MDDTQYDPPTAEPSATASENEPVPHSPLPWQFTTGPATDVFLGDIESADDWSVVSVWADVPELPAKANAEFIVRAVNNHDELLAALRLAEEILRNMLGTDCDADCECVLHPVWAAIAKAEGR